MVPFFRLVFPPHAWREQVPALVRGGGLGVAHLARNFYQDVRELVVTDLRPVPAAVRGRQFGPLDDLLVVRCSPRLVSGDADHLLAAFGPLPAQLVAGFVLGYGPGAGQWLGGVWDGCAVHPLGGFSFVGPGMRRVTTAPEPPETPEALERWSRTRGALGDSVWRKVRASRVAVVGAGRNGSATAMTLAMLGVRGLVLIDGDQEALHNLDASVGGTPAGVGRPKVFNRAEFLRTIRPTELSVKAIPRSIPDPLAVTSLRGVDLIVTCVDRDLARLAVARAASGWGKVHLDVGTGVFGAGASQQMGADVRLLLPGEACLSCLGGLQDPAMAEWEAVAPQGSLRRGRRREWGEERAGSLSTINQMAVNVGVQLWLELLAGGLLHSCWHRLEWVNCALQVRVQGPAHTRCALCRPDAADALSGPMWIIPP